MNTMRVHYGAFGAISKYILNLISPPSGLYTKHFKHCKLRSFNTMDEEELAHNVDYEDVSPEEDASMDPSSEEDAEMENDASEEESENDEDSEYEEDTEDDEDSEHGEDSTNDEDIDMEDIEAERVQENHEDNADDDDVYDMYTDADVEHRPSGNIPYLDTATDIRLESFLDRLRRAWLQEGRDQNHIVIMPDGYELYGFMRTSDRYDRYDWYLYGHPNHHRFCSASEFLPHYVWLQGGKKGKCQCKYSPVPYKAPGRNHPECACYWCGDGRNDPPPPPRCSGRTRQEDFDRWVAEWEQETEYIRWEAEIIVTMRRGLSCPF